MSAHWSWRTPGLIELATQRFPEPIADKASAWFGAWHEGAAPTRRALDLLIESFEVTVQFVSLLALADYRRIRGRAPRRGAEDVLRRLLTDGQRLTTGLWWAASRSLVEALRDHATSEPGRQMPLACPELVELARPAPGGRRQDFDEVPALRNRVRHGDTPASPREEAEACHDDLHRFGPALAEHWERVRFLADYQLARTIATPGAATAVIEDLTGSRRSRVRQAVALPPLADLEADRVVWIARSGGAHEGALLVLDPFVVQHGAPGLETDEGPALLEGCRAGERDAMFRAVRAQRDGGRVTLRVGKRVEDVLRERPGADDPALKLKLLEDLTVGQFVAKAASRTEEFVDAAKRSGVYLPTAFLERQGVTGHFEEFLQNPGTRLLLLTGSAGAGKTSLLCNMAEGLLQRSGRHVTLLLSASGLPSEKSNIVALLGRLLGVEGRLPTVLGAWKGLWHPHEPGRGSEPQRASDLGLEPGRIMLMVDGLDRSAAPIPTLRGLLDLVDEYDAIKLAVTVALPVIDALDDRTRATLQATPWVHQNSDGPADGRSVLVAPLDFDELARAYQRYRLDPATCPLNTELPARMRAAAQNPLLLRLVCEQFSNRTIPPTTSELDVLVDYTRSHVFTSAARQDFVARLVGLLDGKNRKSRHLVKNDLLGDPLLRSVILAPDGEYDKLIQEHVLTEYERGASDHFTAPVPVVEFTFDVALGYLLLAYRRRDVHSPIDLVRDFLLQVEAFPPAGFALDLALRLVPDNAGERLKAIHEVLRHPDREVATSTLARFFEWLDSRGSEGPDPVRDKAPATAGAASMTRLVSEMVKQSNEASAPILLDVADQLRKRGSSTLGALLAEQLYGSKFSRLPPKSAIHASTIIAAALRQRGVAAGLARSDELVKTGIELARKDQQVPEEIELWLTRAAIAEDQKDFPSSLEYTEQAVRLASEVRSESPPHFVRSALALCPLEIRTRRDDWLGRVQRHLDAVATIDLKQWPRIVPEVTYVRALVAGADRRGLLDQARREFLASGEVGRAAQVGIDLVDAVGRGASLEIITRARELAAASGSRGIVADALYEEGRVLVEIGQLEQALETQRQLEALAEELRIAYHLGRAIRGQAVAVSDLGNIFEARRLSHRHVRVLEEAARELGARCEHRAWWAEQNAAFGNFGDHSRALGHFDVAVQSARAAVIHAHGDEDDVVWAEMTLALSLAWKGPRFAEEAERLARKAMAYLAKTEGQWDQRHVQVGAALGLVELGRSPGGDGRAWLRTVRDHAPAMKNALRLECFDGLAYLAAFRDPPSDDDLREAVEAGRLAVELCRAQGFHGPGRWMAHLALYRALRASSARGGREADGRDAYANLELARVAIARQLDFINDSVAAAEGLLAAHAGVDPDHLVDPAHRDRAGLWLQLLEKEPFAKQILVASGDPKQIDWERCRDAARKNDEAERHARERHARI